MRLLPVKVLNNMVIQMGEDSEAVNVTLHKTVRIPDDGKTYPLPPSLGMFPIMKVDDYKEKVPKDWLKTGGVFFCMYQSEAMWMQFHKVGQKPKAMKIAVGKVNAINGKGWKNELTENDSDYLIVPQQKWLDGIASAKGSVKQFVAMPLGSGMTIEKQVTGKEDVGGIQLLTFNSKHNIIPEKKERKRKKKNPYIPPYQPFPPPYVPNPHQPIPPVCMSAPQNAFSSSNSGYLFGDNNNNNNNMMMRAIAKEEICECICEEDDYDSSEGQQVSGAKEIGIAAGGSMKQKVYEDEYGYDTWDQTKFARVFIHIVNSQMYEQITGEKISKSDINAKTYTQHGYPWFDVYDEDKKGIGGSSEILKNVKSIKQIKDEKNMWPKEDNETVEISNVITVEGGGKNIDPNSVRDGEW